MYQKGAIGKKNYIKASELFKKACDNGENKACSLLKSMPDNGQVKISS